MVPARNPRTAQGGIVRFDGGPPGARPPRVVIVGAGMGGLAAARALRRAPVDVTVIDAHNYSAFAPLLFEAAVGVIVPEDLARPARSLLSRCPNATFRVGRVVGIDWGRRSVRLADDDELPFEFLVLAPGVVARYQDVPGAAEHAVPLKGVTDAARLRNSILRSFEAAAAHRGRTGPGATTIAIVGGGATGTELAGYLADILFRSFARDYPMLPRERMKIVLVERGGRLLPAFDARLGRYAEAALRRRGVDVRLSTTAARVDESGLVLDDGTRVEASTVVWGGGVTAPDWLVRAGVAMEGGRVVVGADLRLPGRPRVFAIGDVAAARSASGSLRPQVAQVAIQGGRHAGRQIERIVAGRPTRPFRYLDKGSMAMVGVYAAVVESGRLRLTGRPAWAAWALLHVAYLPGMSNRLRAMQSWAWWHVTHEAAARVLLDEAEGDEPTPAVAPVGAREVALR